VRQTALTAPIRPFYARNGAICGATPSIVISDPGTVAGTIRVMATEEDRTEADVPLTARERAFVEPFLCAALLSWVRRSGEDRK